jgi:glycosyltransferase involved in cell wall biosynthesis
MLSLCITTYNRYDLTIESFRQVLDDPRISEIVIVDDCSKPEVVDQLFYTLSGYGKVRFYQNEGNLGMSRNKARAIEYAHNEWCILFDSDNVIDGSYLDAIPFGKMRKDFIYCPSFAKPQFDYRKFAGQVINSETAKSVISKPLGDCLFNTCNYVVNRQEYLRVFQYNEAMKGTDTIWFNYLWLKDGGSFFVLRDMEYFHRVHKGSGFLEECDYNMKKAAEVKDLIKTLR